MAEEGPNPFEPKLSGSPYLADPDVLLMIKFQEGDKAAFEKLMIQYYGRILNFIYRFLGDRETSEDLTQEVFVRVYKNARSYYPKSKFSTWIFTIAKNLSLNELRRLKRKTVSLDQSVTTEEGEVKRELEDPDAPNPGEDVLAQERQEAIRQAIYDLPENQRTAVILRRYEKLSYEDIAKTMNMSLEAVKSLLSRAKENLRNKLSGYINE